MTVTEEHGSGTMRNCTSCGKGLACDDARCASCGAPVVNTQPTSDDGRGAASDDVTVASIATVLRPGLNGTDGKRRGTVIIGRSGVDASNVVETGEPALVAALRYRDTDAVEIVLESEDDRFTVGRDKRRCLAVVDDARASRVHFTISIKDGSPFVKDEGSTNGTYLNGERLGADGHVLASGDRIRIGRTELDFTVG